MSDCEVVKSFACGKEFDYCRTHKVESKDCPGQKKPDIVVHHDGLGVLGVGSRLTPPTAKREFRVGDKVRFVMDHPYSMSAKSGDIMTISKIEELTDVRSQNKFGVDIYFEETIQSTFLLYNGSPVLEHA